MNFLASGSPKVKRSKRMPNFLIVEIGGLHARVGRTIVTCRLNGKGVNAEYARPVCFGDVVFTQPGYVRTRTPTFGIISLRAASRPRLRAALRRIEKVQRDTPRGNIASRPSSMAEAIPFGEHVLKTNAWRLEKSLKITNSEARANSSIICFLTSKRMEIVRELPRIDIIHWQMGRTTIMTMQLDQLSAEEIGNRLRMARDAAKLKQSDAGLRNSKSRGRP